MCSSRKTLQCADHRAGTVRAPRGRLCLKNHFLSLALYDCVVKCGLGMSANCTRPYRLHRFAAVSVTVPILGEVFSPGHGCLTATIT